MAGSGGSGSGGSIDLGNLGNTFRQDPLGTFANLAVNLGTGGAVGYDASTGSLAEGTLTHNADEALGAVDGRNNARDAQGAAEAALNASDAAAAQDLLNTQNQKQQQDITASTTTQAIRTASTQASQAALNGYVNNPISSPNSDEKNFLGL